MDFLGKSFTLGSFEGIIQLYLPKKNSFLVKFNGTDLLEVDATTVLNLLLQKEKETKSDEISKGTFPPNPMMDISTNHTTATSGLGFVQQNVPNSSQFNPSLGGNVPPLMPPKPQTSFQPSFLQSQPFPSSTSVPPIPPYPFPVQQSYFQQNVQFPQTTLGPPIMQFGKTRFQSGLTRHRSLSQPQLAVTQNLKEMMNLSGPNPNFQRRRRESFVDRVDKPSSKHSIHDNCNFSTFELNQSRLNGTALAGRLYPSDLNSPIPSRTASMNPALGISRIPSNGSTSLKESSNDATKAEIFKRIRNVYSSKESQANGLPSYNDIENTLLNAGQINAARISTLRSRNIMKKVFEPVKDILPNIAESYIINSFILICPLCGTSITLNKLGSHINWFKHLSTTHGVLGEVVVSRFEFFETNMDINQNELKQFPLMDYNFKSVTNRIDSAPLESIDIDKSLIPFTTKVCLETLLLDVLIKEQVLNLESILLQEILAFTLSHYKVVSFLELQKVFPKLLTFQKKMRSISIEGFLHYAQVGHTSIILDSVDDTHPIETSITLEDIEKKVLELCKDDIFGVDLDWKVLLFAKAMKENIITNCSIVIQELLVLAFFYFGFITQRTPKKFRIFENLLAFFGGLYKISCKCYDLYVGDGPTGAAHTRGKPVNPSKEIIQRYNHYGLSRKSLQRTLAKEYKEKTIPSPVIHVRKDVSLARFKQTSGRRSSVKRKNSVQTNQTRRRRSSIKDYIPVASGAILSANVSIGSISSSPQAKVDSDSNSTKVVEVLEAN